MQGILIMGMNHTAISQVKEEIGGNHDEIKDIEINYRIISIE